MDRPIESFKSQRITTVWPQAFDASLETEINVMFKHELSCYVRPVHRPCYAQRVTCLWKNCTTRLIIRNQNKHIPYKDWWNICKEFRKRENLYEAYRKRESSRTEMGPWVLVIVWCLMFVQRFQTAIWYGDRTDALCLSQCVCAQMNHACMNTIETKWHALGKTGNRSYRSFGKLTKKQEQMQEQLLPILQLTVWPMTLAKNTWRVLKQNNGRDSKTNWPNHRINWDWENRRITSAAGNWVSFNFFLRSFRASIVDSQVFAQYSMDHEITAFKNVWILWSRINHPSFFNS